jgi:hypothetical protein
MIAPIEHRPKSSGGSNNGPGQELTKFYRSHFGPRSGPKPDRSLSWPRECRLHAPTVNLQNACTVRKRAYSSARTDRSPSRRLHFRCERSGVACSNATLERQEAGCDPAGESPVQERGSARLVVSVASWKATTMAKRTQQSCGVGY